MDFPVAMDGPAAVDPPAAVDSTASLDSTAAVDSATLDAIQLMLRDLHTRHEEIRHKAAFRGCTSELLSLQQELVGYLLRKKSALMGHQPNGKATPNYNSFI
jgi:hypothetical protein